MSKMKVNIQFDIFTLKAPVVTSVIKRCIEATLAAQGVNIGCEINVLVTNNNGIHAVNLAARGIDAPTDVLSFPMFGFEAGSLPEDWSSYIDPETGLCPLGDMCISLEKAIAQADEFGHTVKREIGYLTIHSMLHLLGYDHLDEGKQKKMMREREELIAATVAGVTR